MKVRKIWKPMFGICLLVLTVFFLYQVYNRYVSFSYTPSDYKETTDSLSNPYQGFYRIYRYLLSEDAAYSPEELGKAISEDRETRLALLEVNLKDYRTGEISDRGLSLLDGIFSVWSGSNKQLIVRFLYDWDGNGPEWEPDDIQVILRHMTQTASIVNQYADHIYILQGVFAGSYGEMHSSKYMEEADPAILMEHLARVTDPSIFLSVRTPAYWRIIAKSAEPTASMEPTAYLKAVEENAFKSELPARLGLFNDGMFGSDTDLGTYNNETSIREEDYTAKGTRAEEIRFQEKLCQFVPNGGEVVIDNSFNDLVPALKDLASMHVSYLNCEYDMAVLEKWKHTTYRGDDVFDGCNGFDYVKNHLGYRYVLRSSKLSFDTFRDEQASLSLSVENVGFTNSYRPFQVTIMLKDTDSTDTMTIPIDTDTRFWKSGKTVTISVPLDLRNRSCGKYKLYLHLTDSVTGEQIKFANAKAPAINGYELGSLDISKRPQK